MRIILLRFFHLPLIAAVVLCVVGGVKLASNANQQNSGKTLVKVGIIIFLLTFLDLVALAILTFRDTRKHQTPEKRLVIAVLLSLPFLAIRFLYSLITDFGHSKTFSLTTGSPVAQFFMATLMEWIVTVIYIAAGLLTLRRLVAGYSNTPHSESAKAEHNGLENGFRNT
jgi:uncharacterized membrane protein (DUF485 family)